MTDVYVEAVRIASLWKHADGVGPASFDEDAVEPDAAFRLPLRIPESRFSSLCISLIRYTLLSYLVPLSLDNRL